MVFGPLPPVELTDNDKIVKCKELLSQGAEARVWKVELIIGESSENGEDNFERDDEISAKKKSDASRTKWPTVNVGSGMKVARLERLSCLLDVMGGAESGRVICKERFPKKYRHRELDATITKSRSKAEARCLLRCRRAGVSCPRVLAIASWSSSCLFLEHVQGCTVRRYLERRSADSPDSLLQPAPPSKRPRRASNGHGGTSTQTSTLPAVATVVDRASLAVAHALGTLVAKMHAAGVIHGDLTTSNVMLKNPPWCSPPSQLDETPHTSWNPQLVLIDFGLASSTASSMHQNNIHSNTNNGTSQKQQHKQQYKQHHHAEEKAVDLYVLERAFLSTHPHSQPLVQRVMDAYTDYFRNFDGNITSPIPTKDDNATDTMETKNNTNTKNNDNIEDKAAKDKAAIHDNTQLVGQYDHVAQAVMTRLEQVRMRGRKRDCFG